jgi:hypothetical protein
MPIPRKCETGLVAGKFRACSSTFAQALDMDADPEQPDTPLTEHPDNPCFPALPRLLARRPFSFP